MVTSAKAEPSANGAYGSEGIGARVDSCAGLIQVRAFFTGVTPLLQNAMPEHVLLALRDKSKKPKSAAKPSLREEAESKVHRAPDGRPHIPLRALSACLINAGQFVRLDGKRQITTEKKTVLPGMLTILDIHIPLVKHDGVTPATWEVDIQQGRNPNGGEAVCIVRPRFDEWAFSSTLEIDQEQMPLRMARDLVDTAGRRIGLLEFTPKHKGTFGRFTVAEWSVLPQPDTDEE